VRSHGSPAQRGARAESGGGTAGSRGNGQGKAGGPDGKITICHSTNSDTNPYVEITVSVNAVKAHSGHHDGRDIIPAPAGGCPKSGSLTELAAATVGSVVQSLGTRTAAADTGGGVLGVQASGEEPAAGPQGAVLGAKEDGAVAGVEASGGAEPASAERAKDKRNVGSLPFTGLELAVIAIVGAALLLGGYALRRAVGSRVAA
ncbi:MAG: hypothetical protein M3N16_05000, partial [Actinomycetota bacterium]|nr:hypothetical protein [Actinomycetota bacterium]